MPNPTQTPATTTGTALKYRIKAELGKFSAEIQTEKRKEIIAACGCTRQTLSYYENLPAGHKSEMTFKMAREIARIVGCKPEAL